MNVVSGFQLRALVGAAWVACFSLGLSADPQPGAKDAPKPTGELVDGEKRVTVLEARERAKLMHTVYSSTLEVMHQRFFRRERAVLPARAMEDIFSETERETNIQTGWISVNTKAMSINHEPRTAFEKQAAQVLATGKGEYERVDQGFYQRATAIPLGSSCVGCHEGLFAQNAKTPRFAGLVIRIPVREK